MKEQKNEIYTRIDEDFILKFKPKHRNYMKKLYYDFYSEFCVHYKRKPLTKDEFYSNMHRRRIQLYQLCCPYCGTVEIIPVDKKLHIEMFKYCPNCGRGSTFDNLFKQVSRFIRIEGINRIGLKEFKKEHMDTEEWVLGYDCYQMEIIELASIIEVVFRDCFEALLCINNFGTEDSHNAYIKKTLKRYYNNDFMNIEKANNIFKKAYEINIKEKLDNDTWFALIDIVALRNMMVHNNGNIDEHFKSTSTYKRLQNHIVGNLFKLESKDIAHYLDEVIKAVTDISDLYLEKYYSLRNSAIANFYFN